ncbi:MAG: hypothetical protein KGS48_18845 [Bacteroidetes bacterium]|nr:hypothetical protein [Bacteroidota bacterium]
MEGELLEIKATLALVREDLKPGNLVKSAFYTLIGAEQRKKTNPDAPEHPVRRIGKMLPVQLLANMLVRDPRLKVLFHYLAPVAIDVAPEVWDQAEKHLPSRLSLLERWLKLRAYFRKNQSQLPPSAENQTT